MITFAGSQVGLAEGLTNINGQLLASFRTDPGQPNRSNSLGALALTGELTDAIDYAPMTAIADMDGLAVNPLTMQVMGIDTDPFHGVIRTSLLGRDPASFSVLGQFDINPGGYTIGDLDFFSGQLYGIDDLTNRLHLLDPASGARLGSVLMSGGQSLQGLAAQVVPGPGTLALLGLAGLLSRSRRRRA
jgi:MYXO-CTERM domain-containing protein